uniref:Uncharacterized protein n=1 Tax=Cacopsylla melanoneura TaxID=428564 RepID=A0A8D8ZC68_9HEMI
MGVGGKTFFLAACVGVSKFFLVDFGSSIVWTGGLLLFIGVASFFLPPSVFPEPNSFKIISRIINLRWGPDNGIPTGVLMGSGLGFSLTAMITGKFTGLPANVKAMDIKLACKRYQ